MSDCLIIGGGVVGLSLAYELARSGARVRLIEAARPGAEASWAGAGILPPASTRSTDPRDQLAALSNQLHLRWHDELLAETGIDNGLRRSGGVYLARDPQTAEQLRQTAANWQRDGIDAQPLADAGALAAVEPGLAPCGQIESAFYLPAEFQIRNPRHLRALEAGCLQQGVEILSDTPATGFVVRPDRLVAVETPRGLLHADRFCITSGVWSGGLVEHIAAAPPMRPLRGQIALLMLPGLVLSRVVNEGPRYLVPRGDGRVLVGSTVEDVGYDRGTTAVAIGGLLDFAISLCPALAGAQVERCWAGLRPGSIDGWPYLGRIESYANAWLAAGHFRGGLQLSTGTAVVLAALLRGEASPIDLAPFRIDRADRATRV